MPWGAAVAAGGALLGGAIQSRGVRKAGQAQGDSIRYAADLEQKRYDQNRQDMAPWMESGKKSLGELNNLMYSEDRGAALRKRPGYQFRLDEGLRALQRAGSAGSRTGRLYRGLVDYGQNTASNEYMNEFNRLSGMAGTGQQATQFTSQLGARSAENQAGYAMNAGESRASAYIGQANILGNALGPLASAGIGAMASSGGSGPVGGNFYESGYTAPGGVSNVPNLNPGPSFDPYAGAGGYGDNWTNY